MIEPPDKPISSTATKINISFKALRGPDQQTTNSVCQTTALKDEQTNQQSFTNVAQQHHGYSNKSLRNLNSKYATAPATMQVTHDNDPHVTVSRMPTIAEAFINTVRNKRSSARTGHLEGNFEAAAGGNDKEGKSGQPRTSADQVIYCLLKYVNHNVADEARKSCNGIL